MFLVIYLIFLCQRRKAAVGVLAFTFLVFLLSSLITSPGRVELCAFMALYLLTVAFQLVTTGSFLEQGSKALVIVTAIHAGLVVALFWSLLANAIVAMQVVEDNSLSSLIVCFPLHITINSKNFCIPAFLPRCPHCFRCNPVYLSRHRPGNNTSHWRCIESPGCIAKHSLVYSHEHMAASVSIYFHLKES